VTFYYALAILWRERLKFLPAVFAVTLSAVLIAMQFGVLFGTLSFASLPIDRADADLWIASREVLSLELGYPIPETWLSRLRGQPEVRQAEAHLYGFGYWQKPGGGALACCVVGSRLEDDSLGAVSALTADLRRQLTEPGAVVIDDSDVSRLGLKKGPGETAEVFGHRVRVVGLVHSYKSIAGPFVFCSLRTARTMLPLFSERPGHAMYLLARCGTPDEANTVAARLRRLYPDMSVFTRQEFSARTQLYWTTQTQAGLALAFTSGLALLVGLVVTQQTLSAATASNLREYALLRALGIPRWRLGALILAQAFWIGVYGVSLAMPAVLSAAAVAEMCGSKVSLPPALFATTAACTMIVALLSGLTALRALRLFEPIALLR
jgi:putative ABC transport system permease protein